MSAAPPPGTAPAMILVGQYDSPVTRRVAIALHHYGMAFTRDTRSVFSQAEEVGRISPLTRIPALVLPGGEVLIDSAAILDHLDEQAGPQALMPRAGPERLVRRGGVGKRLRVGWKPALSDVSSDVG